MLEKIIELTNEYIMSMPKKERKNKKLKAELISNRSVEYLSTIDM